MSKTSIIPTRIHSLEAKPGMPVLRVSIGGGEDIDMATRSAVASRHYKVVAWVVRGQEFVTPFVEGKLDPIWNRRFEVLMDPAVMSAAFLHVEVIRASSDEPGTSRNATVVGRARIPLPKLPGSPPPSSFTRYGLTVPHGGEVRPGGHIYVLMEIRGRFTEE
nr:C2 domain-containing protein [Ipomoea batatas]